MPKYVPHAELIAHAPEVRDGVIVGCMGCQWTAGFWIGCAPQWTQYLSHLPTFTKEGALLLTHRDNELLKEMHISVDEDSL